MQTLHWIDFAGLLVLVQNRSEGQGWRPPSELEGFHLIAPDRGLFFFSSAASNVYFATVRF